MKRRFEMYSLRRGRPASSGQALAALLRDCGRFIPELQDSAVGWNRSGAAVDLVWEHAYADDAAYQRYMEHAYHACLIDRFVLPGHPERITSDAGQALGLGLLGYDLALPRHRLPRGVRRVVALRLRQRAEPGEVSVLMQRLGSAPEEAPELALSICAPNSMGLEWNAAWTHLWEQGFESERALRSYLAGDSLPARIERARFDHPETRCVEDQVDVWYAIDPARGRAAA